MPSVPTEPSMLMSPAEITALQARMTDPDYLGYYQRFKAIVDTALGGVSSSLGDDRLSKVAKGAAALHLLGVTPTQGAYSSYRDVAVAAARAMSGRSPAGIFGGGNLTPDKDAGRLQSLAEAYDMLRGSGLSAVANDDLRRRIADWADAFKDDFYLPFRQNNLSLKGGAALISVALAMPGHARAWDWLQRGTQYINDALATRGSVTGWWREGPHYTNYSLGNLVSTSWHVLRRTGVDWFPALEPFVRFAIDTRQPDGRQAPFEEGVSNCFPHHVLIRAFAQRPIQAEMQWALESSPRDFGNYGVASLHSLTAFVFAAPGVPASAPKLPATRFVGGDTHAQVLRSSFAPDALQATMITAVDYSSLALISSRHNMQNPMDLVVAGAGEQLLVTSGGGPQVTTSSNRSTYLSPSSRNLVRVDGFVPYVTDGALIESSHRLSSQSYLGFQNRLCDLATTTVSSYGAADRVSRSVAMIGGEYLVVADRVSAPKVVSVDVSWRGRGSRSIWQNQARRVEASWSYKQAELELYATGTGVIQGSPRAGVYAPSWGVEEPIEALELSASGREVRLLTLLEPRTAGASTLVVTPESTSDVAAFRVTRGARVDRVLFGEPGVLQSVGDISFDGRLLVLRFEGSSLIGLACAEARAVRHGGRELLRSDGPVTVSLSIDTARRGLVLEVSQDQSAARELSLLDLPGIDAGASYRARSQGAGQPTLTQQGSTLVLTGLSASGRVALDPDPNSGGPGAGPGVGSGGQPGGGTSSGGTGNPAPVAPAVPPTAAPIHRRSFGCSVGAPAGDPEGSWALLVVLVLLAQRRRRG